MRLRVSDIGKMELTPWIDVLFVTSREVVHHEHLMTLLDKSIHQVAPNEPGSTGHYYLHRPLRKSFLACCATSCISQCSGRLTIKG